MSRTFPPISPVPAQYVTAAMPRTRGPRNQLLGLHVDAGAGIDPRLTETGDWNTTKKLPPYAPYGYLDPRNVFSLRPA